MFQTWLESSRRFRTLQTPAQWLSSSNKEQVRRRVSSRVMHQLQFSIFASRGCLCITSFWVLGPLVNAQLCQSGFHFFFFSSLLYSSLQRALPKLGRNWITDGTRGSLQGYQVYFGSEPTSSSDGGPLQSLCSGNHSHRQQKTVNDRHYCPAWKRDCFFLKSSFCFFCFYIVEVNDTSVHNVNEV